jgi:hypothetical protein
VNDLSFFDYAMVCFSAMHRRDIWLAVAEGPSEPREGFLGLVAQRVDLGDFVGTTIELLLDQSPWGRAAPAEFHPQFPSNDPGDY